MSRCVLIHHGAVMDIGGRALVSLREVSEVGQQSPGVMNFNEIIKGCHLQSIELKLHTKARMNCN